MGRSGLCSFEEEGFKAWQEVCMEAGRDAQDSSFQTSFSTTTKSAQLLVHFKSVSINKFTPIHHAYNLYTLGDLVIIQEFRIFNNFLTGF